MKNIIKILTFGFTLFLTSITTPTALEARCGLNFGFATSFYNVPCRPICRPCRPVCMQVRPDHHVAVGHGAPSYAPCLSSQPVLIARGPSNYDRMKDTDYFRARRCRPCAPVCERVEVYECETRVYTIQDESCLPTINEVYDCGELIQLSDKSLWQIPACYKQTTRNWMPNDQIQISRSDDQCYPFRLSNLCSNVSVKAMMKAAPIQQNNMAPQPESANDKGLIEQNIGGGDMIQLQDGTLWEIASYEQHKTKLWRKGDTLQVSRSGNSVYPYQLTNLYSQETAEANLKTSS